MNILISLLLAIGTTSVQPCQAPQHDDALVSVVAREFCDWTFRGLDSNARVAPPPLESRSPRLRGRNCDVDPRSCLHFFPPPRLCLLSLPEPARCPMIGRFIKIH
jgi:hypothetical protein